MDHFTNDRVELYPDAKVGPWKIISTDPYGLFHIERVGGVQVPACLDDQSFVTRGEAKKQIEIYVNAQITKENKPPQDKNTRKVQEVLKARSESLMND